MSNNPQILKSSPELKSAVADDILRLIAKLDVQGKDCFKVTPAELGYSLQKYDSFIYGFCFQNDGLAYYNHIRQEFPNLWNKEALTPEDMAKASRFLTLVHAQFCYEQLS
jgi:hypothetical protein